MAVLLICLFTATSCSTFNDAARTVAYTVYEKAYTVSGRVLNVAQNPIQGCSIVLIKRVVAEGKDGLPMQKVLTEMPVAVTDTSGDFSFMFEPGGADDLWLYIDGTDSGYSGRFVSLHDRIGHTVFEKPGNNPLMVTVVLEKTINLQEE